MDLDSILVPMTLFLSPALIVWIVSQFNARKRNTVHETLRLAIDKGQTLSPEMLEKMSLLTDPVRADLRRGVLALAFGAAVAMLGLLVSSHNADVLTPMLGIACFPIFIGIAYVGLWAFSREKSASS